MLEGSAFIFYGCERFLAYLPPHKLAATNLSSECRAGPCQGRHRAVPGPSRGHARATAGTPWCHLRVTVGPSEVHHRATVTGPPQFHPRATTVPSQGHHEATVTGPLRCYATGPPWGYGNRATTVLCHRATAVPRSPVYYYVLKFAYYYWEPIFIFQPLESQEGDGSDTTTLHCHIIILLL